MPAEEFRAVSNVADSSATVPTRFAEIFPGSLNHSINYISILHMSPGYYCMVDAAPGGFFFDEMNKWDKPTDYNLHNCNTVAGS